MFSCRGGGDTPGGGRGRGIVGPEDAAIEIVPLHGSLEPAEQDRALAHVSNRRIILATNIAETSLTVPGVTAVVDTGTHKVARYDPERAIDSLEPERISRDSADQRAGRGGASRPRASPGACGIGREASTAPGARHSPDRFFGPLLDVLAWGGDARTLDWFNPPATEALAAGWNCCQRFGALDGTA